MEYSKNINHDHSTTKIVIIISIFLIVFSILLFVILAGSNPLSHKQTKKTNNKHTSADKPVTSAITNTFDTNATATGTANTGGLIGDK